MVFGKKKHLTDKDSKEECQLKEEIQAKVDSSTRQNTANNGQQQGVKSDKKVKDLGLPHFGGDLEEVQASYVQLTAPSDKEALLKKETDTNTSSDKGTSLEKREQTTNSACMEPIPKEDMKANDLSEPLLTRDRETNPVQQEEIKSSPEVSLAEQLLSYLHILLGAANEFWNKHNSSFVAFFSWPILAHVALAIFVVWIFGRLHLSMTLVVSWMTVFLWQVFVRHIESLRAQIRCEVLKEQLMEQTVPEEETTRWLNQAMERAWNVWLERVVSLKMVPLLAPWFLQTYKPGVLSKLEIKSVNMGSRPPVVRTARVYAASSPGHHLDMEMDVEVLCEKDMFMQFVANVGQAGWAGIGLIPWTAYATDLHLIGRIRMGIQFSSVFPFVNSMEMSFVNEPKMSIAVKVMGMGLGKGFDAAGLPLVAGYVDATLKRALKGSIVAPNKLVIDDIVLLVKTIFADVNFDELKKPIRAIEAQAAPPKATPPPELKRNAPQGYVTVEILEAEHLMAADTNGFSDPYVKGHLGRAKFVSSIKRTTLSPKWREEFKLEVPDWSKDTVLQLNLRDYDRFTSDDELGSCQIDLAKLRNGERHDMWIKLSNATSGSIHVGITVFEELEGDNVEKGTHEMYTADGKKATVNTNTVKKETGDVVHASATLKDPALETDIDKHLTQPPSKPGAKPDLHHLSDSDLKRRAVRLNDSSTTIAPGCAIVTWDV